MKILTCLLTLIALTTSLIAQDAPIPQDIPLQRPTKPLDSIQLRLLNSMEGRLRDRQAATKEGTANTASVEDRIAGLEAKVAELQREVEAQKAIIKQLEERLDQQKKN